MIYHVADGLSLARPCFLNCIQIEVKFTIHASISGFEVVGYISIQSPANRLNALRQCFFDCTHILFEFFIFR
ncbi:MAG TPA: hypothetical protein DF427_05290 [Moraxellaceae bacterium]|nr:hypothetical protein [Moraxellaceae bacterium]